MVVNFAHEVSLFIPVGFFNMPYNLTTWDCRLYVPSEGSLATDFVALKNPSSSAGFEPENLESNGKYANHYTT
jgi:hypothetical protein